MNGRVYDPVLGRFLSADPMVDSAGDGQAYNRYSYVGNEPLNHTDPSGYFKFGDALKIVAVVAIAYLTAGAALYALGGVTGLAAGTTATFANCLSALAGLQGFGLSLTGAIIAGGAGGFASGFAGSLLNGGSIGDAFKAGLIGGIAGAVSGGLGYKIGGMNELGYWGKAAAHGLVNGAVDEAEGGQFRHGFYAGFATGGMSKAIGLAPEDLRFVVAAVIGGTASAVSGGKFANGAVSAAFQYLLNDAQHRFRITHAYTEVCRPGFENFDEKAKAVVDFVDVWDMFPANRLDGLTTVDEAIPLLVDKLEFLYDHAETAFEYHVSPTDYPGVVQGALSNLKNTVGSVGPFEARTIIKYETLETRPFLMFFNHDVWVEHELIEPVLTGDLDNHSLYANHRDAQIAATRALIDRLGGLKGQNK